LLELEAILDAILNSAKCSRVPRWHHTYSESNILSFHLIPRKKYIQHLRVPPTSAGLLHLERVSEITTKLFDNKMVIHEMAKILNSDLSRSGKKILSIKNKW
jgi:hypothetical protein